MSTAPVHLVDLALPVPLTDAFTYLWPDDAPAPPRVGDLVRAPFGRRRLIGLVTKAWESSTPTVTVDGHALRRVAEVFAEAYRIDGERLELARWLADYYAAPLGEVVPLFHPPAPGTKARRSRGVPPGFPNLDPPRITPTADQTAVLARVGDALDARRFETLLLHGVTGSGKTEVYLQSIAAALSRGRGAILLLPEIALTPQTEARVRERLGDGVATLHSGLSAGERCRVHEAAAAGEIRVVVGPRSALFAPVRNLGIVVMDEEHEGAYKQDERPRYHARHAALVRARLNDAPAILGSATPDLESWRNGREGRYRLFGLSDRPSGILPEIEIVDMRGEPASDGFSPRLLEGLDSGLAAGRQALLFYNRRGFARSLQCTACGEAPACPACDITLTVHLRPRRLICHYCGHSRPVPAVCPDCGAADFRSVGGGTEKLEIGLAAHFPEARVLRLDQDTTRRRGSHARILTAFASGEADILIGTQMVAKGHHFPGVDLVGVLAADDGLHLPDFRAQERAFQLLIQVAGRTGRERPGRVIFQTWQPEHPVIVAAAAQDFETFGLQELAQREILGYPPHRRLLRIGVSGRRLGDVTATADDVARLLREDLADDRLEILGPAPAVFSRLNDRFRHQLLVKGSLDTARKAWLAECLRRVGKGRRGVDILLDIDPIGLF